MPRSPRLAQDKGPFRDSVPENGSHNIMDACTSYTRGTRQRPAAIGRQKGTADLPISIFNPTSDQARYAGDYEIAASDWPMSFCCGESLGRRGMREKERKHERKIWRKTVRRRTGQKGRGENKMMKGERERGGE